MTKDFVPAPVPESHGLSPRTSHPPPPEDGIHLDGLARVVVSDVSPEVDGGRSAAKRVLGDTVTVEVDLVVDGHERVAGCVRYRKAGDDRWREAPLTPLVNDRWQGRFTPDAIGLWEYTVEAWHDVFGGWRAFVEKRLAAGQDPELDLLAGQDLLRDAAARAQGPDREALERYASALGPALPIEARTAVALSPRLAALMFAHADRGHASRYPRVLPLRVDRPRARFSTWYETFPRSAGKGGAHGTLRDLEERLPYIASMGFDVLYLPPIHPIGHAHRKGRNNTLVADAGDPGSPWAIGGPAGGHDAVHPELGTLEDFRRLVETAKAHGMEVAMDIALQASPDHPWVTEHPEWFRHRADGSIAYAENPPKKYEDIYPFDFASADWRAMWVALRGIFLHWIAQGVSIFRVDNPHTKSVPFWRWCIATVQAEHPEALFLAEAFTRPKLMYALARAGFSQSYTYFTWRTRSWEIREYLTELTQGEPSEYFRPNFWPNTPDILPEHLQERSRAAYLIRLVLASTLSCSYGIYGPAFELMAHVPRPGSEEYIDNEKYELKVWDLDHPETLAPVIARVNEIRRAEPALQVNRTLRFHHVDNEQLLCFSKRAEDGASAVLVVVNLDPRATQSGWTALDMEALGLAHDAAFEVTDLMTGASYGWRGAHNFVSLDPATFPAHLFSIGRK